MCRTARRCNPKTNHLMLHFLLQNLQIRHSTLKASQHGKFCAAGIMGICAADQWKSSSVHKMRGEQEETQFEGQLKSQLHQDFLVFLSTSRETLSGFLLCGNVMVPPRNWNVMSGSSSPAQFHYCNAVHSHLGGHQP